VTNPASHAEADDHPILHAAIALSPQIRALADEIEQARRLPKSIVDALKEAGIFGMPMPRAWAGTRPIHPVPRSRNIGDG
jgi:alkylation response protein AidB-like acyl-CoA dehydrogenase